MDEPMYCFDGPAQLTGDGAAEAFRRGEAEREAAAERLRQAAKGMREILMFPITRDRLMPWLDERAGNVRRAAFRASLWGCIRWSKSLGRPTTAHMADAFSFHHWAGRIQPVITATGPEYKEIWTEQPTPRAWDGPHDDQNYRVSFLVYSELGQMDRFWPEMRGGAPWDPAWSAYRRALLWPDRMIPFGEFTIGTEEEILVLDDYQVVKRY